MKENLTMYKETITNEIEKIQQIINNSILNFSKLSEEDVKNINENNFFNEKEKDFITFIYYYFLAEIKTYLKNMDFLIKFKNLNIERLKLLEELENLIEPKSAFIKRREIINNLYKAKNFQELESSLNKIGLYYFLNDLVKNNEFFKNFPSPNQELYWKQGNLYKKEQIIRKIKQIMEELNYIEDSIEQMENQILLNEGNYTNYIPGIFGDIIIQKIENITKELEKKFEIKIKTIREKLNNFKPHKSSP